MATTNATSTKNQTFLAVLGLSIVAIISYWYFFSTSTPQLGADERIYKTVDSLFTAVTARDEKLVAQSEKALIALSRSGQLSAEPSEYLTGIIEQTRRGEWQSSAEELYAFMSKQERQGERKHLSSQSAIVGKVSK